MRLDRFAAALAVGFFFGFPLYLISKPAGIEMDLGRTGGPFPGEQTCGTSRCHDTTPDTGPGSISVTVNGAPLSEYVYKPGETAAVQVRVEDPDQNRWGFQMTARRQADGCMNAGAFEAGGDTIVRSDDEAIGTCGPGLNFVVHGFAKAGGSEAAFAFNWKAPDSDVGPVVFAAAGNAANGNNEKDGDRIYLTQATVEADAGPPPPKPLISDGGVVLANLLPSVAGGSARAIMSAFGTDFAPAGTVATAETDAQGRVTTNLAETCIELNGERSAMFLVTPAQLNFQASHAVDAMGPVNAVVIRGCGTAQESASDPVQVNFADVSPGFFVFNFNDAGGANPIAGQHNDPLGTPVGAVGLIPDNPLTPASTPAQPGEFINLFATGLGLTDPPFEAGEIPGVVNPGNPIAPVTGSVKVTIGGIELPPADVFYVGVSPCCAGLYQLVVKVPDTLPDGDHQVVIEVNGVASPEGPFITVVAPA